MQNNNPFDEGKLKKKLHITLIGFGEKRDSRINIVLEPTVRKIAELKCKSIGISLSECIDQLLYIWSKDDLPNKTTKPDADQLRFKDD